MKKHILYLTQWYVTDKQAGIQRHFYHIKALLEAGYRVTVITSYVDYIDKKIPPEYEGKLIVKEQLSKDLTIYKTYSYPEYGKDVLSRLKNMSSYSYYCFRTALEVKDISLIIASSPPIMIGLTAYLISVIKRAGFVFEVRDLWPDTPVKMGTLKNKFLIFFARIIEKISYTQSKAIIGLTKGICKGIAKKGIDSSKVSFIPNAADIDIYKDISDSKPLSLVRKMDNEFIAIFAGVHSTYPFLQNVVRSAKYLIEYPNIKLVFVGDGDNKPELLRIKEELNLSNVEFYDTQPKNEIPKILASSNTCIISYQDLDFWKCALPNKIFDYLASSRPVIASVPEGEITEIIKAAECGLCIKPGDPKDIADAIIWLYKNPDEATRLGWNGREYIEKHFDRKNILQNYVEIVNNILQVAKRNS